MSCWLLNSEDISIVTDVVVKYVNESKEDVFNTLWDMNVKSYGSRYGENPEILKIKYPQKYVELDNETIAQQVKSCGCYFYQSCEYDENYNHKYWSIIDEFCLLHEDINTDDALWLISDKYHAMEEAKKLKKYTKKYQKIDMLKILRIRGWYGTYIDDIMSILYNMPKDEVSNLRLLY